MPKTNTESAFSVYTDGASRGNPGPAAVGSVIYSARGEKVSELYRYVGVTTNNIAEYLAVIYGLQEAFLSGAENIIIKTDSQLVARQLKGTYKVKDANIRIFSDIAKNLFRFFKSVTIDEIPRENNIESDRLANKALDEKVLL